MWVYDVQVKIKRKPRMWCGNDSQNMRHITDECSNRRFELGINGIIHQWLCYKGSHWVNNDFGYWHLNVFTYSIKFLGGQNV